MRGEHVLRWRVRRVIFPPRCAGCLLWHTRRGHAFDRQDRCIRRLPGVYAACCGHGRLGGYFACPRGVLRFAGDVHPFLIRAAARRFQASGVVPGWARADGGNRPAPRISWRPRLPGLAGCQFTTPLDRCYRRRAIHGAGTAI